MHSVERRTRQFLERLRSQWNALAVTATESLSVRQQIGPWRIAQHYPGQNLKPVFAPALAHHPHLADDLLPDLEILCIDAREGLFDLGDAPWSDSDLGPMGLINGLVDSGLHALWDYQRRAIHIADLASRFAVVILPDAASVPGWEQTFPFRNLLHWLALNRGDVLVHAAAIAGDEGALLMVGDSGAGKSTTALAGAEAGLKLLGDDFVAVTFDPVPMVHSLYASAKLTGESTRRFKRLAGRMTHHIGAEHEKNIFFLDALGERRMQASAPLAGLVHLTRTGSDHSAMRASSSGTIFRLCAANTLALLPGERERTLAALSRLSTSAPAHELMLGQCSNEIGAFLHDRLNRRAA
ncbi:MAG: hypothetical protein R3E02_06090 [Blastomonas sp.]